MIRVLAAAALILAAPGCSAKSDQVAAAPQALLTVPLTIRTAGGKVHRFTVEVARTADEQSRGLMFREKLAPDGGMIFPMKPPRPASFWMRNTPLSLDMIFVRADGTIARIAAETVPYSLEMVDSAEPVGAVLEIAGGRAAMLGIAEDDKVVWDDRP